VLGPHPGPGGVTLRALRPLARSVAALVGDSRHELVHEHSGVWVGVLPASPDDAVPDYRLEVSYGDVAARQDDPYRFLPTLGAVDLHLIGEGRHEQLWEVLGAHVRTYDAPFGPITGTSFAVWAPSARGVRVIGDFNGWNGSSHPMRALGSSGVWELFVPTSARARTTSSRSSASTRSGARRPTRWPRRTEVPPLTASVVDESDYTWNDDAWLVSGPRRRARRPMSVYEVHLGSWRQGLSYKELADQLVEYVSWLGYTHVELHAGRRAPVRRLLGLPGHRLLRADLALRLPDEFRYLVDRLHQAGIGVIVDWVPAHFPKDEWALARFDGTPLYEHADPKRGEQMDWGTYVFDFGRREVRNFLVANASYWLEEFHIDALRVDAVASMLYLDYSRKDGEWSPNQYGGRENLEAVEFLQEMNSVVYRRSPGAMTIAEESTAWPGVSRPVHLGGLGFGFKWNMGWMHDSLDYMAREPLYRGYHHHQMTFSMVYAYSENYLLPISHDEVVHGKGSLLRKMPGDRWQQLANLRAYLAFMWAHPASSCCSWGRSSRRSRVERGALARLVAARPADHRGVALTVKELNAVYKRRRRCGARTSTRPASPGSTRTTRRATSSRSCASASDGSALACISNFAGMPHDGYRLGLPWAGHWREVLNTDAAEYFGSGVGNFGGVEATGDSWHGQPGLGAAARAAARHRLARQRGPAQA
jgi:1,4-alpha-glucan branching enzyme